MLNSGEIIRKVKSSINEKLKIIVRKDGKKLLNTRNTNYSYGTLLKVLEYGLDNIPLTNISSVLVLGMVGGSVIKSLRQKYKVDAPIVAVEIDPVIINLAKSEFKIHEDKLVEIHCADAWDYVENCKQQFDLIIIDIFIDLAVPEKFYEPKFWKMTDKIVNQNGFILFNAGIDLEKEEVREFVSNLPDSFIFQKNHNVLETNTVIIKQKIL